MSIGLSEAPASASRRPVTSRATLSLMAPKISTLRWSNRRFSSSLTGEDRVLLSPGSDRSGPLGSGTSGESGSGSSSSIRMRWFGVMPVIRLSQGPGRGSVGASCNRADVKPSRRRPRGAPTPCGVGPVRGKGSLQPVRKRSRRDLRSHLVLSRPTKQPTRVTTAHARLEVSFPRPFYNPRTIDYCYFTS